MCVYIYIYVCVCVCVCVCSGRSSVSRRKGAGAINPELIPNPYYLTCFWPKSVMKMKEIGQGVGVGGPRP